MSSYINQWRRIRKGFAIQMEINSRIGEDADYREQDVVNCNWNDPSAIQQMGWVSNETAERWSNEWSNFLSKRFRYEQGWKGSAKEISEWYDNYGSQEDIIHMVLTSRVLKNDFKEFWLNCFTNI